MVWNIYFSAWYSTSELVCRFRRCWRSWKRTSLWWVCCARATRETTRYLRFCYLLFCCRQFLRYICYKVAMPALNSKLALKRSWIKCWRRKSLNRFWKKNKKYVEKVWNLVRTPIRRSVEVGSKFTASAWNVYFWLTSAFLCTCLYFL